jgi:hypothetical protein
MLAFTIFLGVACAVLLVMLSARDNKNTKLEVENSLIKGRMEGLQDKLAQQAPAFDEPLTAEGIAEAIRRAGYVPEVNENWVRFMIQGEPFYVETGRLPQVFVLRQYNVDTKEWEMDILRHAAHLMSDELIMIKATFDDDVDENGGTGLRFFVAAMDRNYSSFRDNLMGYIHLIEDGRQRMNEVYEKLVKEKRDAALTVTPFLQAEQKESKIMS